MVLTSGSIVCACRVKGFKISTNIKLNSINHDASLPLALVPTHAFESACVLSNSLISFVLLLCGVSEIFSAVVEAIVVFMIHKRSIEAHDQSVHLHRGLSAIRLSNLREGVEHLVIFAN